MTVEGTEQRKKDHLEICLNEKVEVGSTQLENVTFVHKSVPESDFDKISTETSFLGKKLKMPFMIAAVTGGIPKAKEINKDFAAVAEKYEIGFGLGSQRAMIENPERGDSYHVRDVAPNTLIFGNMGITQIRQFSIEQIKKALEAVKADALCVHINPAQEMFQTEGDRDFSGCLDDLKNLCSNLETPVIGKEVGNGMSKEVAQQLEDVGVKGIDVGGFGGTSWVVVDAMRCGKEYEDFGKWGIPTACSILETKTVGLPIIATGGVRTGQEIAKSIALGADICGIALPFLRIWHKEGKEGVEKYVEKLHHELKIAMHLTGSKNIEELKKAEYVLSGKVYEWASQRNLL